MVRIGYVVKRVLFWTQHFWPYIGGVEVIGSRLPLALRERGYAFVVVTSHGALDLPDEDTYEGIPTYRLPFHRALAGRDVRAIARSRREVARIKVSFGPDLVHVHLTDASALFHLETADVSTAPLLLSLHVAPPERGGGSESLLGARLRSASWVTAASAVILEDARRLAPEIGPRSSVVHGGMARPALANELVSLLEQPDRARALGAAARRRAVETFSLDRHAEAYVDVYRRCLQGASGGRV